MKRRKKRSSPGYYNLKILVWSFEMSIVNDEVEAFVVLSQRLL